MFPVTAGLEAILNQYLRFDPASVPRLAKLDGKVIAIEVTDWGQQLYICPKVDGVRVLEQTSDEPNAWIRGTAGALFRRWRGISKAGDQIVIEGDTEVAQTFQAILAHLDIDWEEQLAQRMGDPLAHCLSNLWRGFQDWNQRASITWSRNSTEYLQQELRALPSRYLVEGFLNEVDTLREDADRLMARIERLRRVVTGDSPAGNRS